MTDKLRRLREWLIAEADIKFHDGGATTFYLPDRGAPTAPDIVAEIDRLLAEPDAAPNDAEVEAAIKQLVEDEIAAFRTGKICSMRKASVSHADVLAMIARRVAAAKADAGLLAAAKAAFDDLVSLSPSDPLPSACALRDAIAAREAGGAK